MKRIILSTVLGILLIGGLCDQARCEYRLGGGLHYLRTLGDIKDADKFDEDALGFLVSYQKVFSSLRFEGDVELIPDFGGSDKMLLQPQAWVLLGSLIYVSGGIGIGYFDGDWQDNPFYAIRAGVDLAVGGLNLDGFASYRFQSSTVFEDLDQNDLDALTLGVIVRLSR